MCYISEDAIQKTPMLALQSIVFSKTPKESFTSKSLEAELQSRGVREIPLSTIEKCVEIWLDNDRIFRTRGDRNAYRVAFE